MKTLLSVPKILIITLIVLFSQSCGTTYKYEIEKIDSLLIIIDRHTALMNKYSDEYIKSKNDSFIVLYSAIDTLYNFAKIDTNFHIINSFINIQKPFRQHPIRSKKIKENLEFKKEQLLALKQDIKNNAIPYEAITKYLTIESNECQIVFDNSATYYKMIQSKVEVYDTLSPQIVSLIEKYRDKAMKKKHN